MKALTIAVCLKAVPDPKRSGEIRIDPVTKTLRRGDLPLVANPADRCALEQAIRFKEEVGGMVKAISMGPPAAAEVLKQAMAMGADEAHLLSDRAFAGADSLATARALGAGIRTVADCDLVITGAESSDGGTAQVGPELACFLKVPHVSLVEAATLEEDGVRVHARSDEGYRALDVRLPALLTVVRDINVPRGVTFSGIVRARGKEVRVWSAQDLGMSEEAIGLKGSPTTISGFSLGTGDLDGGSRRKCEILGGDPEAAVDLLVEKLSGAGVL